ncbi:MAG: hypothetical protein Q9170_002660 [Blastenia crenularia]
MAETAVICERSFVKPAKTEAVVHSCQAPWTAARCQRLLRPLSSKIALLRREKQRNTNTEELRQAHTAISNASGYDVTFSPQDRRRKTDKIKAADEEWAPNPRARKRIKRTYSSRSLKLQHRDDQPQLSIANCCSQARLEITIPTNFLQANRQPGVQANNANVGVNQGDIRCVSGSLIETNTDHDNRLVQGPSRCNYKVKLPFQWKLMDGIHKGMEALLKATERHRASPSGARGLFATCLRRVPEYIAQEELRYGTEDPDSDIDVSTIIYSDLESLSTSETGGWTPLRQIVRVHGISIVGNAVREGLIGKNMTRNIIALCVRLKAYDEAEYLLGCLVDLVEPLQKNLSTCETPRSILEFLDDFVSVSSRHSFRYRILVYLLRSERISLDWIARPDMMDTWNSAVGSVTQNDDHAGPAGELLRLVVNMYYGLTGGDPAVFVHALRLRRSKFDRKANGYLTSLGCPSTIDKEPTFHEEKTAATISSLMTVLCAIGLLKSANPSSLDVHHPMALQDIAIDAQQIMELSFNGMFAIRNDSITVPLLAAGLVQPTLCQSRQAFTVSIPAFFDGLMSLDRNGSVVEKGGSFLCAVADCCARGMSEDVFDHMQKLVQHIRHIAESLRGVSSSHEGCSRIGVAAALEYADNTKHPKHLHWALDLEQAVTGAHLQSARRTPAKTPLRGQGQTRSGYRWEAGICEWVAKTPAISLPRPQVQGRQDVLIERVDDRGTPIHVQYMATGAESSPCKSDEQSNEALMNHSIGKPGVSRTRSLSKTLRSGTVGKESARGSFFSNIYVDGDGDELSTSESSQKVYRPQQNTQFVFEPKRKIATKELRAETRKRGGSRCMDLKRDPVRCVEGLQDQDPDLDSEDELSFL